MGGGSGNQMVINPRSGHGYAVPVGIFETILYTFFFNPALAIGILAAIVGLVLFVRYLYKHISWK